jgi:hypothetical protein
MPGYVEQWSKREVNANVEQAYLNNAVQYVTRNYGQYEGMEADIASERIALKTTAPHLKGEDAYQKAADNVTQRATEYDKLIQQSVQVEQEVAALRVSPDARIASYQASVGATAEERVQSYLRTPEETQLFEQGRQLISRDLNAGLTLQQVRHEHDVIRSQGEEQRWSPQDVSRQAGYLADEMRTRIVDHPPTVEIHAGTYRWDQEAFRQGAQQGVSDFSLQHDISQGREQSAQQQISYSPQDYAYTLSSYQNSIRSQWAESLALATDTPERLAGHFRDEIAGLNQHRQELIQQNPSLEKTLPPAMDYRQELVRALDAGWQKQAQQEQTVQVGYGF